MKPSEKKTMYRQESDRDGDKNKSRFRQNRSGKKRLNSSALRSLPWRSDTSDEKSKRYGDLGDEPSDLEKALDEMRFGDMG